LTPAEIGSVEEVIAAIDIAVDRRLGGPEQSR
jgi:hypothetical protein